MAIATARMGPCTLRMSPRGSAPLDEADDETDRARLRCRRGRDGSCKYTYGARSWRPRRVKMKRNRAVRRARNPATPVCRRIAETHIFDHSCASLYLALVSIHPQCLSQEGSGRAICGLAEQSVGLTGGRQWRVAARGGQVYACVHEERC